MATQRTKRGFTLVEMLVVITIMALILGIAIGSFSGQGNSTRISSAFEELASAIRYTRMYAIGNNQKTYLILFGNEPSGGADDVYVEPRDWYRYYRGYTAFATVNREQIMETRLLPPGLLFDDTVGDPSGGNGVNVMSDAAGEIDVKGFKIDDPNDPMKNNTVTALRGIAFMPDGTLQYESAQNRLDPALIVFTEGFTNADEKVAGYGSGGSSSIRIDKIYEKTRSHFMLKVNPLAGNIEQREYIAK
jgi:prepilin-type N-terminal cleavage/methylation domain-containing protein